MYDKVRFWIDRFEIGEEIFQSLPTYLTRAKDDTDREIGETKIKGYLANLRVMVNESGISMKGSLLRFFHCDEYNGKYGNLYPLNRHDTKKAIEMLSQRLGGVPIQKAKVRALEFGDWMSVNFSVAEYLNRCGSYPRLERFQFKAETLYYRYRERTRSRPYVCMIKEPMPKQKGMNCHRGLRLTTC